MSSTMSSSRQIVDEEEKEDNGDDCENMFISTVVCVFVSLCER